MTRDTVSACPECDATDVVRRVRLGGYRCERCSATFDEPENRPPKQGNPDTAGGLSPAGRAALEWEPPTDEGGEA